MNSKKHTTNHQPNHNTLESSNPNYQFNTIKYQKLTKTNIIHNINTNKIQHKYFKLILKTTLKNKTNTIPTYTPLTKIKTYLVNRNNQTNNATLNKYTKYYLKTPYTPEKVRPLTLFNNKTGSASRPCHKTKTKSQCTNNWIPTSITNHILRDNNTIHFAIQHLANTIPTLPNLFTTTKYILIKYLKTNNRNPKIRHLHGYYFINKLMLLQCGDIEPNPDPMPDILRTHPATHKKRAKTYFIPNTIKLQPEYQHLANTFVPILHHNHPLHHQTNQKYPHLHQYLQTHNYPLPSHILYALIITIHPSIDTCNNILAQPHNYHYNDIWTNTLIIRLANLNNPPERHILTQHPYTTFVEHNQDLINPKDSIHNELYEFIHSQVIPPSPITLQRKFPFLPEKLITKSLRCLENIDEYSHPPPLPNTPTPTLRTTIHTEYETNIITWNASSLNTALPNLQSLINHSLRNTTIINIQKTKLTATKSTKYIQNIFLEYKLIFNNTHALTRCIQQRMPYTPGRGGLLTLIHNKYAFPGNITKIPTPANISPYLQIIKINNNPLPPWLIIHMYMPTPRGGSHPLRFITTCEKICYPILYVIDNF